MALKDLGYNHICCRCGQTDDCAQVWKLKIDLGDDCYIVRLLCRACMDSFEAAYRKWWEKK